MNLKNLILTTAFVTGLGINQTYSQEQIPKVERILELEDMIGDGESDLIRLNLNYPGNKRVEYIFTAPYSNTGFSSKGKRVYYNGKIDVESKFKRKEADSILFKIMDKHQDSKPGKYLVDREYAILDTLN